MSIVIYKYAKISSWDGEMSGKQAFNESYENGTSAGIKLISSVSQVFSL